jgi:hypothetical protein
MSRNGTSHVAHNLPPAPCDEDEILDAISATPYLSAAASANEFLKLSPIYFIGDSRTIVFRNTTYTSPFTSKAFHLRSVFLRNLCATDFYSPAQGLNSSLLTTLATDLAAITYDEGTTWSANRRDFEADAEGRSVERGSAPLVLFCGAFDSLRVLDELGPDVDVLAWDASRHRRFCSRTTCSGTCSTSSSRWYSESTRFKRWGSNVSSFTGIPARNQESGSAATTDG